MEIDKTSHQQNQYPSRSALEKMTNNELFEVANQHASFREVMEKFISRLNVKPKPLVIIYDEEGNYDIRKIGLPERLKNVLLQNDFEYLSDFKHVRSEDLFKMKYFGEKSYEELLHVLDAYGFQLAD
jgi:DNA-directed RNA polymerase alpha subunit